MSEKNKNILYEIFCRFESGLVIPYALLSWEDNRISKLQENIIVSKDK